MYRPLLFLVLYLTSASAPMSGLAQSASVGGRMDGMAGAGVALMTEPWPSLNPAAPAALTRRHVALSGSQAYGFAELRHAAITASWPFRIGTPALHVTTFGYEAYRNTSMSLGFAGRLTSLGGGVFGGLLLTYRHIGITDYGSAGATSINAGWILTPLAGLHFGGSIENLTGSELVPGEDLPQVARAGIAYHHGRALAVLDLEKEWRYPASLRIGVSFEVLESLWLRTGAATDPTRTAFGAGYATASLSIDLTVDRHHLLGWTPAASLAVSW